MIPYYSVQEARGGKESEKHQPQAIIVLPTEALMTQVYDYLQGYAYFYEYKYKFPLKIGRVFKG